MVIEISKSEKILSNIAGFSESSTAIPFAIFCLYFSELSIERIQPSMMQVMSPPVAILALLLAAHMENSFRTMSAAFFPYHVLVYGMMKGKLTSSRAAVIL